MKVAFVSQPLDAIEPSRLSNSIALWTYEVARRLARSCDVAVYSLARGGAPRSERRKEGVSYRYVSGRLNRLLNRLLRRWASRRRGNHRKPLFAAAACDLAYASAVARDVRARGADIVHIHNFSQFVPVIAAFAPRSAIALHMHCEWLSQLDRRLILPRVRKADLLLGCSDHITGKIRAAFPRYAHRCRTVHNGVDTRAFRRDGGRSPAGLSHPPDEILFVGRISPEKGLHVLLDALEFVAERRPDVRLTVVGAQGAAPEEFIVRLSGDDKVSALSSFYTRRGDGAYRGYLERRLSDNLAGRVTFAGHVPHREVRDFYHRARLLVNPSLSEAFGMSLIEAMACEVPVVATAVGGMTEIVGSGETGLLVEAGSARGLAEAVLRVLENPHLGEAMGRAGRRRARELFEWDEVCRHVRACYGDLVRTPCNRGAVL